MLRKYEFNWNLIGDIEAGRPNLGSGVDLEMYRLMQFTMRDAIERRFGTEVADEVFFDAGKIAGAHFYKHHIESAANLDEFVCKTQKALRDMRIGILRVEEADVPGGRVILTVDEDLDCSGLPELDYETCIYDEGFISALFESFFEQKWNAEEIDCWCTGARTCRFSVEQDGRTPD